MWRELLAVFDEVTDRLDHRVLVITGEGDGFCSGADLTDPSAGSATVGVGSSVRYMRLVGRCALRLHDLPKPTVVAVNGVAAGPGCNLALGCDIVLAAERARFIEIFSKRGLVVDFGGSWLLPRLIGLHRAKELVFLAEPLDVRAVGEIGLVNRVVPSESLLDEAHSVASRLAVMPPVQLSVSKRLLNQSLHVSMAEALEAEDVGRVVDVPLGRHRGGDASRSWRSWIRPSAGSDAWGVSGALRLPPVPRPRTGPPRTCVLKGGFDDPAEEAVGGLPTRRRSARTSA